MKSQYPVLFYLVWLFAAILEIVTGCEAAVAMFLFGLCCGKKSGGGDCRTWPRWLTLYGEMRILPWHIMVLVAAAGELFFPVLIQAIIKWLVVGVFGTLVAYPVCYGLEKWADKIGDPLPLSAHFDEPHIYSDIKYDA